MIVVIMGPAGAGKTTYGRLLAAKLGWQFVDADDYHSPANIEKLHKGIGLTEADRAPWLAALRADIGSWVAEKRDVVLACSALKRRYRETLRAGDFVRLVYLRGTREVLQARLRARLGHFVPAAIIDSQLAELEEPAADEGIPTVAIDQPLDAVLAQLTGAVLP
jgi:gluconokinase